MTKKINNGVFYVAISLVAILAVGTVALAYSITSNVNVEGDYNNYEATQETPEANLGAFPGNDIYDKVRFHDGIIGNTTFQETLNFQAGTSTGSVAIEGTQIIPGYIRNDSGGDLLCKDVILDISTANGIFGYDIKVGTSTSATTTDGHLIADTSVTTSTADILSKEDDEGTTTTEVWDWDEGEYLVVTQTFDVANATSSASFTTAGGNATVGTINATCWYRNN